MSNITSIAQQLIPIYNTTVHKNKSYIALMWLNCCCYKTRTCHKGERSQWLFTDTIQTEYITVVWAVICRKDIMFAHKSGKSCSIKKNFFCLYFQISFIISVVLVYFMPLKWFYLKLWNCKTMIENHNISYFNFVLLILDDAVVRRFRKNYVELYFIYYNTWISISI